MTGTALPNRNLAGRGVWWWRMLARNAWALGVWLLLIVLICLVCQSHPSLWFISDHVDQ